jgi:hypothetical protein
VTKTIICNPSGDSDFRHLAEQHSRRAGSPAELERRLRERYPAARVVEGIANGFGTRWYAYRDGRWISRDLPAGGERRTDTD